MSFHRLAVLAIACSVTLLFGCTQRIGDFTMISTKNVEVGGKYKKLDQRYKGEDSKGMFIGIPLGIPNLKTAVDNCIEAGNGELLSNAVVESSFWTAIIWGETKYIVTGDVWLKATTSDLYDPSVQLYELQGQSGNYRLVSTIDITRHVQVDYLLSSR